MPPSNLKSWDFVKKQKHDVRTLRPNERPEDFYYQYDGYIYSPAFRVSDWDLLQEKYGK
jgi:hypothetical protein